MKIKNIFQKETKYVLSFTIYYLIKGILWDDVGIVPYKMNCVQKCLGKAVTIAPCEKHIEPKSNHIS